MTFTKENSEKARLANEHGRARQRETREQNIQEVQTIVAELLSGLKRAPVGAERVTAEVVASTVVAARRLRERGHSDAEERQLLRRLLAISPFGLVPQAPPERIDVAAPGTFRVVAKGEE